MMPTCALTDSEKTVTTIDVAGIPVRNEEMVAFGRHYGLTIVTCEPADLASKGGSENAVNISGADLVPTDANLLAGYDSFIELEAACEAFCDTVNTREHCTTRRTPVEMLAAERLRLHPLLAGPRSAALHGKAACDEHRDDEFETPCCGGCPPSEVLKALLTEEVAGRTRSALATRREAAGFSTGKTFDTWYPDVLPIPKPTQQVLQTREWKRLHRP